jgi:hypothetical protein
MTICEEDKEKLQRKGTTAEGKIKVYVGSDVYFLERKGETLPPGALRHLDVPEDVEEEEDEDKTEEGHEEMRE